MATKCHYAIMVSDHNIFSLKYVKKRIVTKETIIASNERGYSVPTYFY